MINKEESTNKVEENKPNDMTRTDISAHILIKDKDTGKVLVDKRG